MTTKEKEQQYQLMLAQAISLTEGCSLPLPALANCAALLWSSLEQINWAGFYLLRQDTLYLGPFQGKTACTVIPVGRGVCGTAVAEGCVQRVANVHAFPGHIACDSASNSEIVLPVHANGHVVGVLDIDSPTIGRFCETDREFLLKLVDLVEARCNFSHTEYTLD